MAIPRPAYAGPQCPRCRAPLPEEMHDGANVCMECLGDFEARVFRPPQRSARVLQLAQSGPEGAVSCANHARNAAVAACDRCGLLICSLCQLDVESGKLCPSCFERMSQDGAADTTRTRWRDYGSLAGVWAFAGLIFSAAFLGIPLGILSLYYCVKAFRNRESRSSVAFVIFALFVAVADIFISTSILLSLFKHR
ncbi:MAG TPA: hypothetical protein VG323_17250 [Thermoanaerobaculia bacterium]|nr:hypothetical protein [Thermoanaerobaculia bacterium]